MARKKHVTKELIAKKSFFKNYTNRIEIKYSRTGTKKLKKVLTESGIDHKIRNGFPDKMIYYNNDDHDLMIKVLTDKANVKRIESITRPYNGKAKSEMLGDKHLMVVKSLPFKKFRYKIVFKQDYPSRKLAQTLDHGYLKSQSELDTIRLCWNLKQQLRDGEIQRYSWYWTENYFYVEDEATTSMATLIYSDIIGKIYIYKTYDEMSAENE